MENVIISVKRHYLIIFLRNTHTVALSIKDDDKEQNKLSKELSNTSNSAKPIGKRPFLKNVGFLFNVRGKVSNSFKSYIFPIKSWIKLKHLNQHRIQQNFIHLNQQKSTN